MKFKNNRLNTIRKLVQEQSFSTQEDIARELKKHGYEATQATVSRDILRLRLQKIRTMQGSIYVLPQTGITEEIGHLQRMLDDFVNDIARAGNLIVLKTSPGSAQGVASALDNIRWAEIVGTIAGDDTILLITVDEKIAASVVEKLEEVRGT